MALAPKRFRARSRRIMSFARDARVLQPRTAARRRSLFLQAPFPDTPTVTDSRAFTHPLTHSLPRDAYITRNKRRERKKSEGNWHGWRRGRLEGVSADRFDHNTPPTLDNVRKEEVQRCCKESEKAKFWRVRHLLPDRPTEGEGEGGSLFSFLSFSVT